jgi:hypothetical protein
MSPQQRRCDRISAATITDPRLSANPIRVARPELGSMPALPPLSWIDTAPDVRPA